VASWSNLLRLPILVVPQTDGVRCVRSHAKLPNRHQGCSFCLLAVHRDREGGVRAVADGFDPGSHSERARAPLKPDCLVIPAARIRGGLGFDRYRYFTDIVARSAEGQHSFRPEACIAKPLAVVGFHARSAPSPPSVLPGDYDLGIAELRIRPVARSLTEDSQRRIR
jgi:hypothetical protein